MWQKRFRSAPLVAKLVVSSLGLCLAASTFAQTVSSGPRTMPLFQRPKYERLVPGLLARPVFDALDPERQYRAEVWGLLVGPGRKSEEASLPGNAVLLLRSGRGMISIGGKNQELGLGRSVTVARGDRFQIENLDQQQPISIRALIVRSIP